MASCSICHDPIIRSGVTSCQHHFCYGCIRTWCCAQAEEQPRCPTCRSAIYDVQRDVEYDQLCAQLRLGSTEKVQSKRSSRSPAKPRPLATPIDSHQQTSSASVALVTSEDVSSRPERTQLLTITFTDTPHAGVTLVDRGGEPGVKVAAVSRFDAFYAHGVRAGDVLLEVNGMPCVHHANVINAINYNTSKRKALQVLRLKVNARHEDSSASADGSMISTLAHAPLILRLLLVIWLACVAANVAGFTPAAGAAFLGPPSSRGSTTCASSRGTSSTTRGPNGRTRSANRATTYRTDSAVPFASTGRAARG